MQFWMAPPSARGIPVHATAELLPKPCRLAATPFARTIRLLADSILAHRFPIFAAEIVTGPKIEWRHDYINNKSTGLSYFRTIPYLDVARAGDHKWIWELNRHQHLVVLAQAVLLFDDPAYVEEIERQLLSWTEQNPFQRGINWASALEAAFRAVSWLWVLHLAGQRLSRDLQRRIIHGLYRHGLHIENNLSFYFSPNTHLLGEAVALHALAVLLPALPCAARWKEKASRLVAQQMHAQVRNDGSHFEQSTYYHVYALDMFLFHAALSKPDSEFNEKLSRMADYLDALLGPDRLLPFLGDDDGGRWFHPYGERAAFGRATLAAANAYFGENRWTCQESDYWELASWWFDFSPSDVPAAAASSRTFKDSGRVVLRSGATKIVFNCGPFGRGSGGHSHSDALSVVVTADDEEILIDPGTFTYVGDANDRNLFRGSAAHNTIRIDTLDQADAENPFRWANHPQVSLLRWNTSMTEDIAEAECLYRGFRHRRHVYFVKPFALLVVDFVQGAAGNHLIEQLWHFASEQHIAKLCLPGKPERRDGWRSRCFGQREHAPVLAASTRAPLPAVLPAALCLREGTEVDIAFENGAIRFELAIPGGKKEFIVNYESELR